VSWLYLWIQKETSQEKKQFKLKHA